MFTRPLILALAAGFFAGAPAVAKERPLAHIPTEACALVRTLPPEIGEGSVRAGRFYPGRPVAEDPSKIELLTESGSVILARAHVLATDLVRCPRGPACFKAGQRIKTFRIADGAVRDFGHLEMSAAHEVAGILHTKAGGSFVSLKITSDESVLVRSEGGAVELGRCDDVRAAATAKERSKLVFGFTLGLLSGKSAVGFANLLTEVPDRSDVGGLRTPLYTEQSKGTGQSVDACARYRFGGFWGVQGCGFFEQYRIRTSGKENPSVGVGITYDELRAASREDIVQLFGFGAAFFGELRMREKHAAILGAGPRAGYVISKRASYDYLTGSVFKATETSEATGPEGILTTVPIFVEYEYRLGGAVNAVRVGTSLDGQGQSAIYFGFDL